MKARNLLTILFLALNLALSSLPLRAEESRFSAASPLPRAEVQTAVFNIQYADVKALTKLLDDFSTYLSGSINCDVGSRTIAVVGSKELVSACTEAIKRLDVPPKGQRSIELTIYILLASKKPIPDGGCPPELQSFCGQMKGIFKGFKLLETISTRTVDGKETQSNGIIASSENGNDALPYGLTLLPRLLTSLGKADKPTIRMELDFVETLPQKPGASGTPKQIRIRNAVDFLEGQEVAVSTLSQGTPGESLCIVAKAKILD